MKKVDARGVSCPQPVLMTKKACADDPKQLEILVDNMTAKGNVERFLNNAGYKTSFVEDKGEYTIKAGK